MGPGGLRVAPIHRVLPDLSLDAALAAAQAGFRVAELPVESADHAGVVAAVHRWLATPDESGFLVTDGRQLHRLANPSDEVRASVPPEAPPAWRRLDVVLAHHGLLAGLWHRSDDPESVVIVHTAQDAVRTAATSAGDGARRGADAAQVDAVRAETPHRSGPPPAVRLTGRRGGHALRSAEAPADRGTLRPRRQFTSHTEAVPVVVRQKRRWSAPSTSTTSPGCQSAMRRCSARS